MGGWKVNRPEHQFFLTTERPLINPAAVVLGACRASHQELEHNLALKLAVPFSSALTSVRGFVQDV